jgi:hypothetical protein
MARSLEARRPPLDRQASRTKRPLLIETEVAKVAHVAQVLRSGCTAGYAGWLNAFRCAGE